MHPVTNATSEGYAPNVSIDEFNSEKFYSYAEPTDEDLIPIFNDPTAAAHLPDAHHQASDASDAYAPSGIHIQLPAPVAYILPSSHPPGSTANVV